MGLFGSDPEVVQKWLPRRVRREIKRYRPELVTPETDIYARVDVSVYGGEARVMLEFNIFPVKVVEYLNPVFENAETDWQELAEVAAWAIMMENLEHLALVKQAASELGDHHYYLKLRHYRCVMYQSVDNPDLTPLRVLTFS